MIKKSETVLLVAVKKELPKSLIPGWNIVYSGVGKINASFAISKAYNDFKPKLFINYGTAGTLNKNLSGLLCVNSFEQRDIDVTGLGFKLGETPFESLSTIKFSDKGYSCSTGDDFVTKKPKIKTDLVDMEAYAYAKFCKIYKIPFYCYKFVSDNANENAALDWKKTIRNGAKKFVENVLNV